MRRLTPALALLLLALRAGAADRTVETKVVSPVPVATTSLSPGPLAADAAGAITPSLSIGITLPVAAASSQGQPLPQAKAVAKSELPQARNEKGVPLATQQLKGLGEVSAQVGAALSQTGSGGGESGKGVSDKAFDSSIGKKGEESGGASGNGGGGGRRGGLSRGDYRAALLRLGVRPSAIAALEAAAGGRNHPLASWAAALAHERPREFGGPKAIALISAALLHGVGVGELALARVASRSAGLEVPPLDSVWTDRLDFLAEALSVSSDPKQLAALAKDERFEFLPRALREDIQETLRFHAHVSVPNGETKPARQGPASAKELVRRARSQRKISDRQGQDWLDAAYRDPLTGLPNRRYLDDHLAELTRKGRVLLTFKLDFLKEVNDEFDHEVGNKLLQAAAAVAQGTLGSRLEAIRRSPTGFAVFVDAEEQDALAVAEALRAALAEKLGDLGAVTLEKTEGLKGTVSIGEAALQKALSHDEAFTDALARAERARAFGKDSGDGNRVAFDDNGPRLFQRRTPTEISAMLRRAPNLAPVAAGFENTRRAPLSDLTAKLAAQALSAAALVEEAPPDLRGELFDVLYRDRLSGLLNRRWLFDHLAQLFRPGGVTRYIALDIDFFGAVNAKLGEEKADLLLQELGALLEEKAKAHGARALHLSGEEFVLLTDASVDAGALAEEVRRSVQEELGERAAKRFGIADPSTGLPLTVTVSLGIGPVDSSGDPAPMMSLATAMAEAMLQRAKEGGRNRVESGEPGAVQLLSRLTRLIRLDAPARAAVARIFAPASGRVPVNPFDNTFKTRGEVLKLVGFNPAAEPGTVLSSPEKHGSWVARVRAKGGGTRVVKIALEATVVNEMAMRGVLQAFEAFNGLLEAPRALAYRRWFLNPVMVMEDQAGMTRMDARHLPIIQKAALALFALTFGIHDLNPGAFLKVDWGRTVLTDFERARTKTAPGAENRVGSLSDTPWVGQFYLNDYEDYRPAYERWRAAFVRPDTRRELLAIFLRAGVPLAEAERDFSVFAENLKNFPEVLKADIAYANRHFRDESKRAGLGGKATKALSELNRAAHRSPDGGAMRDVLRWLNGDRRVSPPFHAEPAEVAALKPLTPAARLKLAEAAVRGKVMGFDGRPLGVGQALDAFDTLAALF